MKQIQNKWFGLWQKIFGSILLMLGFSACDSPFAAMYGMPNADFSIKGTVTDEDGKPIPSATVIVRDLGNNGVRQDYEGFYDNESYNHVMTSDAEGNYSMTTNGFASETLFRIVAKEASHEADSVEVTLTPPGSDEDWYEGEAEVTVNLFLKKKDDGQN